MTPRINFLYQFDKGFFGKTLLSHSQSANKKLRAEKALDSVSDFTKHFEDLMFKQNRLERHPKTDILEKSEPCYNQLKEVFPGSTI